MSTHLPIDCVLAVTYRCNSRCVMCDIWKMKDFAELPISEFSKLPASLRDINLSGGEPFLRSDLPEIVRIVKAACPRARIVISSNGFATAPIVKQMQEILKIKFDIGVAISIDGVGETHDEMRGIPGGFDKAIATVKMLKGLGMTNLRLGYTLTERNAKEMSKVYDLARSLGVEFTHSFAQSSEIYFGGKQNVNLPREELFHEQYEYVIKNELKSWNVKRWLRAYFTWGMREFVAKRKMALENAPGRDFFFMDPAGNIFPSVAHNVKMGNIREVQSVKRKAQSSEFKKFWQSADMEEKRKQSDALRLPVWMICTARTAMRRHPFKVIWWIVKNKISSLPF